MKIGVLAAYLMLLPVLSVDAAPKKRAAKVARRSVADYFRLLPSSYFVPTDRRILRKKAVLLEEYPENAYLKFEHDEPHFAETPASSTLEIAVFSFRGRDVVALSTHYNPDFDTVRRNPKSSSTSEFQLLRYEKGKWRNVTNALSPLVGDSGLHFVLPRQGRMIRVFQRNGTLLAKLYWENGRFGAESFDPSGHRIDGPS